MSYLFLQPTTNILLGLDPSHYRYLHHLCNCHSYIPRNLPLHKIPNKQQTNRRGKIMQFQCGSCGFYKTTSSLQKHLRIEHKIYITLSRALHQVRDCHGRLINSEDYKKLLLDHQNVDGMFTLTKHSFYIYSNKRYVCYNCGRLQFKTLPQTLHHLDKVHNIHISYIKGISKKIVYLDGI